MLEKHFLIFSLFYFDNYENPKTFEQGSSKFTGNFFFERLFTRKYIFIINLMKLDHDIKVSFISQNKNFF